MECSTSSSNSELLYGLYCVDAPKGPNRLGLAADFYQRTFPSYHYIKEKDVHAPTRGEIKQIIDELAYTLATSDALHHIPEKLQKQSSRLRKINDRVGALNLTNKNEDKKARRVFFMCLYSKVKHSKRSVKYLSKHFILNEIKGVYYLGKLFAALKRESTPSDKCLAYAMKALFKEQVNISVTTASENLMHYLEKRGFSPEKYCS